MALPFLLRRANHWDRLHGAVIGPNPLAIFQLFYHGIALEALLFRCAAFLGAAHCPWLRRAGVDNLRDIAGNRYPKGCPITFHNRNPLALRLAYGPQLSLLPSQAGRTVSRVHRLARRARPDSWRFRPNRDVGAKAYVGTGSSYHYRLVAYTVYLAAMNDPKLMATPFLLFCRTGKSAAFFSAFSGQLVSVG